MNYKALDEALEYLEEGTIQIYGRPNAYVNKNKLSTDDLQEMRKALVKCAKCNMFTKDDYENWNPDEDDPKVIKKFSSYKLGYCWEDEGGNYFVYSVKTDRFYFFNHEQSGIENVEDGPISLEYIKKEVDEFNTRYARHFE